jgi:hypothetical protein
MSPLAFDIYAILQTGMCRGDAPLHRYDLVERLASPFSKLDGDTPALAAALEELATACRANGVPPITVMMVKEHLTLRVELRGVCSRTYPPTL